jgi:hypothetical protein
MARCKLSQFTFHFPFAPLLLMRLHVSTANVRTRRNAAIFSTSGHRVRPLRRRTYSVAFPLHLACASSTRWAPKAIALVNLDLTAFKVPSWRCPAMAALLYPPWTPPCAWSCPSHTVSYSNRCIVSWGMLWWRHYRCWCHRRWAATLVNVASVGSALADQRGNPVSEWERGRRARAGRLLGRERAARPGLARHARERERESVGKPRVTGPSRRRRRSRPEMKFLFFLFKNMNSVSFCLFH